MRVLVCRKVFDAVEKKPLNAGQCEHKSKLCDEPTSLKDATKLDKNGACRPGDNQRRVHDRNQKSPFHDLEGFRLPGADLSLAMVDEQAGQIE